MNVKKAIRYAAMFAYSFLIWLFSVVIFLFAVIVEKPIAIVIFFLLTGLTTGIVMATASTFAGYVMRGE